MAGLEKFGAPSLSAESDKGKAFKLAARVEKVMQSCLNAEPKQLDPRCLLVDPCNRDGAPPNIQHVHHQILKSFATQGFDRTRPAVGICVKYTSVQGKSRLIEHNRRFSAGTPLLPPIDESQAMFGTIAGSHFNLALRILASGIGSPAADLTTLVDGSLGETVKDGHKWWILPENTPLEDLVDVSLWRNQECTRSSIVLTLL